MRSASPTSRSRRPRAAEAIVESYAASSVETDRPLVADGRPEHDPGRNGCRRLDASERIRRLGHVRTVRPVPPLVHAPVTGAIGGGELEFTERTTVFADILIRVQGVGRGVTCRPHGAA